MFVNALLLFLVQPMFAKLLLPRFGGSPAVWTTCMLFFQSALLAGYAYSHSVVKLRRPWAQAITHVAVMGNGPRVSAGSTLGFSEPILYVEFRKNGNSIDPAPWWAATEDEKARG